MPGIPKNVILLECGHLLLKACCMTSPDLLRQQLLSLAASLCVRSVSSGCLAGQCLPQRACLRLRCLQPLKSLLLDNTRARMCLQKA